MLFWHSGSIEPLEYLLLDAIPNPSANFERVKRLAAQLQLRHAAGKSAPESPDHWLLWLCLRPPSMAQTVLLLCCQPGQPNMEEVTRRLSLLLTYMTTRGIVCKLCLADDDPRPYFDQQPVRLHWEPDQLKSSLDRAFQSADPQLRRDFQARVAIGEGGPIAAQLLEAAQGSPSRLIRLLYSALAQCRRYGDLPLTEQHVVDAIAHVGPP